MGKIKKKALVVKHKSFVELVFIGVSTTFVDDCRTSYSS